MSAIRFPAFDAVGAGLYAAACASLGYVFRNQKDLVAVHVVRMGRFMLLAAAAVVGFCVVRRLVRWLRFLSEYRLARITPEQLNEKLNAGGDILAVDLQGDRRRTHGSIGIPGSMRMSARALERGATVDIAPSRQVVLYCGCPGEYTSARVALALHRQGIEHVRPLASGLQACRLWASVPPAKVHESLAAAFAYFQRLTRGSRP